MTVLLANMSIEPIITVYIGQLGVRHDHLAHTAGIVMACSAFGSMLTAPLLGAQVGAHVGLRDVFFVTGALLFLAAAMNGWVYSRIAASRVRRP